MAFPALTLREIITGFRQDIRNKDNARMDLRVLYHRKYKEEQKQDSRQGKLISR